MSDEPVSECPECGGAAVRKISGGAGFLFKGDGFYITDYRSDDYKKKASAENGDAPPKAASDKTDKADKKDKKGGADSGTSKTSSDS